MHCWLHATRAAFSCDVRACMMIEFVLLYICVLALQMEILKNKIDVL